MSSDETINDQWGRLCSAIAASLHPSDPVIAPPNGSRLPRAYAMRVIAERHRKSGEWRAWIEDEPEHQYSGGTVIDAVDALVRARRDEIPEAYWLEVDGQRSSLDRWEYVLAPIPTVACPDCVGEVGGEECPTCNGTGVVPI